MFKITASNFVPEQLNMVVRQRRLWSNFYCEPYKIIPQQPLPFEIS